MVRPALLALLLAGAVAPSALLAQETAGAADAAAEQRRALETARDDLKGAEERRQSLAAEVEALKGERGKLQAGMASAVESIRLKEPAVEERSRRIGELVESERQLKASLAARRDVLADVIAALQRMGRQPPPALLVRPNDALEAVRSAMLLGAVVPEMRAEAEALASDLRQMARLKTLMMDERDALAREVADLTGERERLAALVEERQRQQASRERDLAGEAGRAAEIARGVGDLEALITRMEAAQARAAAEAAKEAARQAAAAEAAAQAEDKLTLAALRNPARLTPAMPFAKAKGLLPLPVSGKRVGRFGDEGGPGDASKGVSIAAAPGAPVTAPCDGWVVYAGPFRSYGQLLILNAGDGYHVLLAGMERISVALNQFVLAGEPVATMRGAAAGPGQPATSTSERPVLYVEFRKDRGSIDPSPWWAGTPGEKAGG
jgi:septal ring factor EnvC (AmiA/AmiB activator)